MTTLFIGRFQPFHLGHLDVIKQILNRYPVVIIGIGSAQYEGQPHNPFPGSLRAEMITQSLREEGIAEDRFRIVLIPDIHDDAHWVAHVESLVGPFGPVYSGTPHVQNLFRIDGKHQVVSPEFNLKISGIEVRRRMAAGEVWKDLVPPAVVKILSTKF